MGKVFKGLFGGGKTKVTYTTPPIINEIYQEIKPIIEEQKKYIPEVEPKLQETYAKLSEQIRNWMEGFPGHLQRIRERTDITDIVDTSKQRLMEDFSRIGFEDVINRAMRQVQRVPFKFSKAPTGEFLNILDTIQSRMSDIPLERFIQNLNVFDKMLDKKGSIPLERTTQVGDVFKQRLAESLRGLDAETIENMRQNIEDLTLQTKERIREDVGQVKEDMIRNLYRNLGMRGLVSTTAGIKALSEAMRQIELEPLLRAEERGFAEALGRTSDIATQHFGTLSKSLAGMEEALLGTQSQSLLQSQRTKLESGLQAQRSHLDSLLQSQRARLESALQAQQGMSESVLQRQKAMLEGDLMRARSLLDLIGLGTESEIGKRGDLLRTLAGFEGTRMESGIQKRMALLGNELDFLKQLPEIYSDLASIENARLTIPFDLRERLISNLLGTGQFVGSFSQPIVKAPSPGLFSQLLPLAMPFASAWAWAKWIK